MPDYDRTRSGSMMMLRRNSSVALPRGGSGEEVERRRGKVHYGPGGLPTEGIVPAPRTRPWVSWLALILFIGFLALQFWPVAVSENVILPDGVESNWIGNPDEVVEKGMSLELIRRQWDPEFVVAGEDGDSNMQKMKRVILQQFLEKKDKKKQPHSTSSLLRTRRTWAPRILLNHSTNRIRP
ncbi:hypothetical protein R1sor_014984 [Riccia sorocarpa]|uniref:Uncharacterized protein n=1 Tax=Riccia sorocarpa TaxID=122646 RepID=A0ABD3HE65_9MARC